jgi:hypothetical protein
LPKAKFENHHNVENIVCGNNSSGVIVESLPPRIKRNKKEKRSIRLEQLESLSDENVIKAENDARMVSILKKEKEEEEALKPQRVPLD